VTVIDLRSVSVTFGDVPVLRGVSMTVPSGGWVTVIGPNGAGKSTLLYAIAGVTPLTGEVLLDERPIRAMRRRELSRQIALVPQQPVIPESMTVFDYVLMGRTPYIPYFGGESRHDVDLVREVLGRLELSALSARALGSLSGGEFQRALLARALAQQAPVLLLDEATSSLDIGHQQQALELVEELRRHDGLTVVGAMHDLTLAGQFAEHLVLLDRGRVVAAGSPHEVLTPELIATHYGAGVRVLDDGDGGLVVVPMRARKRVAAR
jgi:cobalamin transport system ATP-binding protein